MTLDFYWLGDVKCELWGVSREEFLSKIPEVDVSKIWFGEEFFELLLEKLKLSNKFSEIEISNVRNKLTMVFCINAMRIELSNSKILEEVLKLRKDQARALLKIVKSHFREHRFLVVVRKTKIDVKKLKEVAMLGSESLLNCYEESDAVDFAPKVRVVKYNLGKSFLETLRGFEKKASNINFKSNLLDPAGNMRFLRTADFGTGLYYYQRSKCESNKINMYVADVSGYKQRLGFSAYLSLCCEIVILFNYKKLNIQKVYFKLYTDHLYRIHTKGFCSLEGLLEGSPEGSIMLKHIYFNPGVNELTAEQKSLYMDNLRYYWGRYLDSGFYESREKAIEKDIRYMSKSVLEVDCVIRMVPRANVLPMLALLLKSKEFLDKSGIFSAERYIGVYHGLVVELKKIEKYRPISRCIRYQVVQSVIELYIQGYEKEVMRPMFFTHVSNRIAITKELVYEFIDTVMEVTFKQVPGLQLLVEFVRKYARYRVKKYGTVLSKLEDSVIEYNYSSKSMTIKRLLGDMLERLKNKVIYKCRVKMLEESVAKNCYSVGNMFVIHPCDLDILMSYYNEELVNVKNMSFEEFIDDSEIFDPNNEFNIKNQKVIKKLESLVNNQSAISDNEIKASKYTIVPFRKNSFGEIANSELVKEYVDNLEGV